MTVFGYVKSTHSASWTLFSFRVRHLNKFKMFVNSKFLSLFTCQSKSLDAVVENLQLMYFAKYGYSFPLTGKNNLVRKFISLLGLKTSNDIWWHLLYRKFQLFTHKIKELVNSVREYWTGLEFWKQPSLDYFNGICLCKVFVRNSSTSFLCNSDERKMDHVLQETERNRQMANQIAHRTFTTHAFDDGAFPTGPQVSSRFLCWNINYFWYPDVTFLVWVSRSPSSGA